MCYGVSLKIPRSPSISWSSGIAQIGLKIRKFRKFSQSHELNVSLVILIIDNDNGGDNSESFLNSLKKFMLDDTKKKMSISSKESNSLALNYKARTKLSLVNAKKDERGEMHGCPRDARVIKRKVGK